MVLGNCVSSVDVGSLLCRSVLVRPCGLVMNLLIVSVSAVGLLLQCMSRLLAITLVLSKCMCFVAALKLRLCV